MLQEVPKPDSPPSGANLLASLFGHNVSGSSLSTDSSMHSTSSTGSQNNNDDTASQYSLFGQSGWNPVINKSESKSLTLINTPQQIKLDYCYSFCSVVGISYRLQGRHSLTLTFTFTLYFLFFSLRCKFVGVFTQ